MWDVHDTIVAIATARAPGVRGIVRVSGVRTVVLLSEVLRVAEGWDDPPPAPRVVCGRLDAGQPLGEIPVEVYFWPTARSYTRQPAAEIHTVGSAPVLDGVVQSLCRAGARLARPGEFTMRAFLAGRVDLTQAEAVLGVIEARSQSELDVALQQLAGGLAQPLHALRQQLLDLLAHLEAGLDFVEEDIQFISHQQLQEQLAAVAAALDQLVNQMGQRGESSQQPRVVLRGLPNTGKSSLFNALVGTNRSIVSPIASTTRDYVAGRVALAGRPVQLIDTAGVEEVAVETSIAGAAQRMTEAQAGRSAIELLCIDGSRPLSDWERRQLADSPLHRIVVLTKGDRPLVASVPDAAIVTSSRAGSGLEELGRAVATRLDQILNDESAVVATTAARCADSLRLAAESIARARQLVQDQFGEELVAAELRIALDQLGLVVGAVCTDDILDRIFSRFCIGK